MVLYEGNVNSYYYFIIRCIDDKTKIYFYYSLFMYEESSSQVEGSEEDVIHKNLQCKKANTLREMR